MCLYVGGRDIKSLKTKCDNATNGCQWTGELGSIEEHLATCDYALLPCPNECTDINAGDKILKVLRKDMEKHLSEDCPRREYVCPYCKESGEYQKMITTHLEECDSVEVPCPNEECGVCIERQFIFRHLQTVCDFERVHCKYEDIGCQEEVLRKDLAKHENDVQYHLQFTSPAVKKNVTAISVVRCAMEEIEVKAELQQQTIKRQENTLAHFESIIISQTKEINELKSKLEKLETNASYHDADFDIPWGRRSSAPVWKQPAAPTHSNQKSVFKFTNFAKRKSLNESVFSPPIYSNPGGYKMCFKVYASGCGKGQGSHVSVYAYLMCGENDDHLPWPFTGKVVIELLNQLEDRNHRLKSVQFTTDHDSSQRVVDSDDDRANSRYGRQKYIPHSSLGYNPATDCQYLKDDCLYFRFEIICESTPKPWLASANVF